MLEYIPKMLKFGHIGSSIAIAAGIILIATHFFIKLISNRPTSTIFEVGAQLIIDGAGFYTLFFALKIIATNIGLI